MVAITLWLSAITKQKVIEPVGGGFPPPQFDVHAGVLTFTVELAVLFERSESGCVDEALAVLTMVCPSVPEFTVAIRVNVVEEPLSKLPIIHIPVDVA